MKQLCLILIVIGFNVLADAPEATWKDQEGLTWTYLPYKLRFQKSKSQCEDLGFRFPVEDEFYDAIQYGLFNPFENTSFALSLNDFDWFWMGNDSDGVTSHIVADRNMNRQRVLDSERFNTLCVKK